MIFIAGPCLAESRDIVMQTVETLSGIFTEYPEHRFIFKASYRKANRTSADSFSGVGDETALSWIKEVGEKYKVETLTDIHSAEEAGLAARYVSILQIPAFLARQTDIIAAAAKTGRPVNIKKGQFMAAEDMAKAAKKAKDFGAKDIWLTERGTFFGYHDLVVDFRNILIMKQFGYPVIYDATHSVQQPSLGECSGGKREFARQLALAAVACRVDGIFFETHPNPAKALCDSETQLPLETVKEFVKDIIALNNHFENK